MAKKVYAYTDTVPASSPYITAGKRYEVDSSEWGPCGFPMADADRHGGLAPLLGCFGRGFRPGVVPSLCAQPADGGGPSLIPQALRGDAPVSKTG